jgi:hypothetical protein
MEVSMSENSLISDLNHHCIYVLQKIQNRMQGIKNSNFNRLLILLSLLYVLAISSCTSVINLDSDAVPEGSEGYISIYSRDLRIKITPVTDGIQGETIQNSDWWSTKKDFRISCSPGVHEFIINHQNYKERFLIPVKSGQITFLSFRRQIQDVETSTSGWYGSSTGITTTTTTTYYVRASLSNATLPVNPAELDNRTLKAALDDTDWGIRHYTVKILTRGDFPVNDEIADLIGRMSVEDPVEAIRISAGKLLRQKKLPQPPQSLFIDSFETNVRTHWKIGREEGAKNQFQLSPGGYQVSVSKGRFALSMRNNSIDLSNRESCRIALECSWLSGKENQAFGLVFGNNEEDFLVFCLSRNGGAIAQP